MRGGRTKPCAGGDCETLALFCIFKVFQHIRRKINTTLHHLPYQPLSFFYPGFFHVFMTLRQCPQHPDCDLQHQAGGDCETLALFCIFKVFQHIRRKINTTLHHLPYQPLSFFFPALFPGFFHVFMTLRQCPQHPDCDLQHQDGRTIDNSAERRCLSRQLQRFFAAPPLPRSNGRYEQPRHSKRTEGRNCQVHFEPVIAQPVHESSISLLFPQAACSFGKEDASPPYFSATPARHRCGG